MHWEGSQPKQLVSLLGTVILQRPYHHCRRCWRGVAPLDRELAIEGTQNSPGVCRMLAVGGVETAFAPGCALLAGVAVSTKAVECQADAIGSDLVAQAQSDRRAFPP